jgi:hypothetical protein
VHGAVSAEQLEELSERHDLVVVCSGRGPMAEVFSTEDQLSPYDSPQRMIVGALFDGIDIGEPSLNYELRPGVGEVLLFPLPSFADGGTFMYFSAIPAGPVPALLDVDHDADVDEGRGRLMRGMIEALDAYFPTTRGRIDTDRFAWLGAGYDVHGALTPAVRRPYAQLPNGRWIVACGDVHVVHDPLMAQGANNASRSAFIVADAIFEDSLDFDELWCRRLAGRLWDEAEASFGFTNEMLRVPPPAQVLQMLVAAERSPALADAIAENFAHPTLQYGALASEPRAREFIRRVAGEDVEQAATNLLAGAGAR